MSTAISKFAAMTDPAPAERLPGAPLLAAPAAADAEVRNGASAALTAALAVLAVAVATAK